MKDVGSRVHIHKVVPRHLFLTREEIDSPMCPLNRISVRPRMIFTRSGISSIMPSLIRHDRCLVSAFGIFTGAQVLSSSASTETVCGSSHSSDQSDDPG